ncbi:MAG: DUF559 domain-containing protein [Magnetospirillum sp.]|nr:DUF559 domain-containing protein [Magnetospirillum sp.]
MFSSKARHLRRSQTEAEKRLWSVLRNRGLGAKFRRQYPVDHYILDFACIEARLAVEADGGQHMDDSVRDAVLATQGWRVLRFRNEDILHHLDGVCEAIVVSLSRERERVAEGRVREPETRCSLASSPSHAPHGPTPLALGGRGVYEAVQEVLTQYGLIARGGVGATILIGTAGSAFWPHFQAARRDEVDPLDNWSRRVIGEVAARFGARPLFPQDGPPFLPFQRWAMAAGPVYPSPMGVLVHPEYGLWHSYRGALEFPAPIDLPARADAANPCESCADKPCVAACPVGAAAPYDVPRCKAHLEAGGRCRAIGCLPRHACPLGQGHAYIPDHAAFHMEAFVTARWR